MLLQLCTMYIPALDPVFKPQPLSAHELPAMLGPSTVILFAIATEKFAKRIKKTA